MRPCAATPRQSPLKPMPTKSKRRSHNGGTTNARDLPWRFGRTTPWGVLVSEVMSQQTQMGRVVPYWTAWMERWPDAAALAEAPEIRCDHRVGAGLVIQDGHCDCANAPMSSHAITPTSCRVPMTNYLASARHRRLHGQRGAVVRFRRTYRGYRHEYPSCAVARVRRRRIVRRQRQARRNARWRNGCCRTMASRNAVDSIGLPSYGTNP